MTAQVTVRAIRSDEQAMLPRTSVSFVSFVNDRITTLGARFVAALDESKRHEGERLIRRYRHLIHFHHPEI